jgi:hypothetical protein
MYKSAYADEKYLLKGHKEDKNKKLKIFMCYVL